jgi:signal transduction histidine kinase
MSRQVLTKTYMWLVIATGILIAIYSTARLPVMRIDLQFLALIVVTIAIISRLSVRFPSSTGHISVTHTLSFFTILMYGAEAAVVFVAAQALVSAVRLGRKPVYIPPLTIVFNSAIMTCATFVTFLVLNLFFGNVTALSLGSFSGQFVLALCAMALVQYGVKFGLAAIYSSLKTYNPPWRTWPRNYLSSLPTYFAGAAAAGVIAKLTRATDLYVVVATIPIMVIVYVDYLTRLQNMAMTTDAAKVGEAAMHVAKARRQPIEVSCYREEPARLRAQFPQIEKLAALGELASGVAHDFNNTLTGILGRAQLLLETRDPEKIEKGLNIIVKSARDGANTVKRIQDFARLRHDHDFQLIEVCQLLSDAGEITQPRWNHHAEAANTFINLRIECEENVRVMGDESELRGVLVNMIFNAVDAMPRGGILTMSARQTSEAIELAVSDSGTGMTEETRLRVFDRFFTTKERAGMGLGLAVSYDIICRHGATVDVESQLGFGTTFRIRLPIPTRTSTLHPVGGSANAPTHSSEAPRARILGVDDEEDVRDLLRDIVEKAGCEAVVAEAGVQALALFDSGNFHRSRHG